MGHSSYSIVDFTDTMARASKSVKGAFDYDYDVKMGAVEEKVHELLDPAKPNTLGVIVRESRDSIEHPNSRAVAILFDVTGSMSKNPKLFVSKLGGLMEVLVKRGFLEHPQILFGGFGDATCDNVPLQIGQFESGNEMDSALTKIYLEGGGGGTMEESADLAMWFLATYAEMDCLEKRGEKGYLFLASDELIRNKVSKNAIKQLVGVDVQEDIPLWRYEDEVINGKKTGNQIMVKDELFQLLEEKFEVFFMIPNNSNHYNSKKVNDRHREMFGQRFLKLENPENVVELIAATIGISEGFDVDDIWAGLKTDLGSSDAAISATSSALALYKPNSGGKMTVAAVSGALVPSSEDDDVVRL